MSPGLPVLAALSHLPSADALGVTSMLEQGHDAKQTKGCANKGTNFMSCCTETEEPGLGKGFSVMTADVSVAGAGWGIDGRCGAWGSIPVPLSVGLRAVVSYSGIFRCMSRHA